MYRRRVKTKLSFAIPIKQSLGSSTYNIKVDVRDPLGNSVAITRQDVEGYVGFSIPALSTKLTGYYTLHLTYNEGTENESHIDFDNWLELTELNTNASCSTELMVMSEISFPDLICAHVYVGASLGIPNIVDGEMPSSTIVEVFSGTTDIEIEPVSQTNCHFVVYPLSHVGKVTINEWKDEDGEDISDLVNTVDICHYRVKYILVPGHITNKSKLKITYV